MTAVYENGWGRHMLVAVISIGLQTSNISFFMQVLETLRGHVIPISPSGLPSAVDVLKAGRLASGK